MTCFCWCLYCFIREFLNLLLEYLSLFFVDFVGYNHYRYIADYSFDCLQPLTDRLKWFIVWCIENQKNPVGTPIVIILNPSKLFLTSCVPYLYLYASFTIIEEVYSYGWFVFLLEFPVDEFCDDVCLTHIRVTQHY